MDYVKDCIEHNRLDEISDFIRHLKNVNSVLLYEDDCNLNLLHFATGVDSIFRDNVINLILAVYEVDINKHSGPGNDYFTAAHIAACCGYENTLRLLLRNGADPYLLDKENNTVWDIAAIQNNQNCIDVIEDEVMKSHQPQGKEIDDSIYYSLSSCNLQDDDAEETIKSEQSVIFIKAIENRAITKVEEKLFQRVPSSPHSQPMTPVRKSTPRKSPPLHSPLANVTIRKTPSKETPPRGTPIRDSPSVRKTPAKGMTPRKLPAKDIPSKKTPFKEMPFVMPPARSPPRKEFKPKITKTAQPENLSKTIITDEDFNVSLVQSIDESILEPIDPGLDKLSGQQLRRILLNLGESPGPISVTTRNAYLRKLKILLSSNSITPTKQRSSNHQIVSPQKPLDSFNSFINAILDGSFNFDEAAKLEKEFVTNFFTHPIGPTDFFVYTLHDPRILNCPKELVDDKIEGNPFVRFIKSCFYIGKGRKNRPLHHLYEAAQPAKNNKPLTAKVKQIIEIWDADFGVISNQIVFPMSSQEAFSRESLMINALGIEKLTNLRSGQQGINWPEAKRLTLGTYLIHKAYQILKIHGARQIRRYDI